MKVLRKLSLLLTAAMITTALAGCGGAQKSSNSDSQEKVSNINISYVKSPLNVPSIIEKRKNLFQDEFSKDNIKVTFPEITEGSKMTEAVASGSLDFCNAIGATSVILGAANGVDIKIIGMYSRAPKAFTIMAKDPNIKSIEDLKGKKVVGPKGTILHQLLLGALKNKNMKAEDVQFINMGIPQGVSALMSGSADAALVAGASVPQAVAKGAHIITTGEGILDATIVIAARKDFLDKHMDIAKRYMNVHNKSIQLMKDNPEETYKLTSEETQISVDQVKEMYNWYDFSPKITDKDIKELEKTQDFLMENGMLKKKVDIKSLIQDISK
ncbi:ABC transporter substrate-binding protein [Clostridium scatologenes]|uniref:Aliphatic sulfonates family ABC transporter, periplasmic ligand-binding protein n=1 Tax=Clostridium scatologenes TaxID=1548 RepID=A0A0E3MC48_CLOSL|nr:NrtA/SsuA/CpmA family ABC transporter substrate-binding protein [Clostridium scatologenes]AKA72272.1 aliphatic sulfonates family ABC transporter, periplasmic ligand-binding protein [Clostridium scatologenes]